MPLHNNTQAPVIIGSTMRQAGMHSIAAVTHNEFGLVGKRLTCPIAAIDSRDMRGKSLTTPHVQRATLTGCMPVPAMSTACGLPGQARVPRLSLRRHGNSPALMVAPLNLTCSTCTAWMRHADLVSCKQSA